MRWRLWGFSLLLAAFAFAFYASRPYSEEFSGSYEGYVGTPYSNSKIALKVRLFEDGKSLRGDIELSHQTGRTIISRKGALSGSVRSASFHLEGTLDDRQKVYLDGDLIRRSGERTLGGQVAFEFEKKRSDATPFQLHPVQKSAPPDLVTGRKKH